MTITLTHVQTKATSSGSGSSQLSIGTYYCLIRLLATCVASSPVVSRQVIEGGVLDTVSAYTG